MRKIQVNIKFARWLIFVVSFILIFLTFTRERKFRYEFQKGTPWQHEDLFAPFNFPIAKLDEEIKRETDSINQNYKLHFAYNKEIESDKIAEIDTIFNEKWADLLKQDSIRRYNDLKYRKTHSPKKKNYKSYLYLLKKILHTVYKSGIYNPTEIREYTNYENYKFVFQRDKLYETFSVEDVYTIKSATDYLRRNFIDKLKASNAPAEIISFYSNFDYRKLITQNLFFDKQKTEKFHQIELNSISKTIGFMQAGELIISKGEIITLDKYRILLSLKNYYQHTQGQYSILIIRVGDAIIILMLLGMLLMYLKNNKPAIFEDKQSLLLIFSLLVFFAASINLVSKYDLFNIYIFPLALYPIIIKTFYGERLALYTLLTVIFLTALNLGNSFEYAIVEFTAGFAAIFGFSELNRRGQIYYSVLSALFGMSVIYFAIAIIQEANFKNLVWKNFMFFGINAILLMLAYPLIYVFEKLFGLISNITLLEYSNTNNPLLQKLSTVAPGTFQHSLQVSNLAEAAAKKVGANHLLVKVGALYHDIGKTYAPAFFIENQVAGYNPHDQIDFKQSAEVIINHVKEGVNMAKKANLPEQLIDFIRTHHGTTTVQYFYKNYIKKYPDKADEIEKFTYPGPRPYSKELVIMMMADSLEAAARSLKEINKDKISNLVESIIDYQMNARQYDEADITFKEIYILKDFFKTLLINLYHARIEYPK